MGKRVHVESRVDWFKFRGTATELHQTVISNFSTSVWLQYFDFCLTVAVQSPGAMRGSSEASFSHIWKACIGWCATTSVDRITPLGVGTIHSTMRRWLWTWRTMTSWDIQRSPWRLVKSLSPSNSSWQCSPTALRRCCRSVINGFSVPTHLWPTSIRASL